MENASKALIIAGAILLAILIISLGIIIFNQAQGVVDQGSMDEVAVTTFNQKFKQYESNNIRGTNVKALLDSIVQNNLSNASDKSKQVNLTVTAAAEWSGTRPSNAMLTSTSGTGGTGKALTAKSYSVACTSDPKSGYITLVTIDVAK